MGEHQGMPHEELGNKVTVADRIERIGSDTIESQLGRKEFTVHTKGVAGEGTTAKRTTVGAGNQIVQPFGIAHQSRHVRHEPMREADWLSRLQVGVTCHEDVDVLLGKFGTGLEEGGHILEDVALGLDGPKASVGGHLIIATTASVELTADGTDNLGKSALVGGMDVLIAGLFHKLAGGPLGLDLLEARNQLRAFLVGDDTTFVDGLGIGNRPANVLGPHSLVKAQTFVELLHDGIGTALEASTGAEQSAAGSRRCCLF
mmetsp:Transcript_3594/g.10220  ORF Transcript_3594/g.10220 Transcript_3594/m.10220 type:complete len:259 (-) Transcript_3594:46-822(-)